MFWEPTGTPSCWHDVLGQSGTAPSEWGAGGVSFLLCWDFITIVTLIALLMQKERLTHVDRCIAVDNYLLIPRKLDSF